MSNSELLKALAAPFAVGDHEFHRGFVYLSEEAIAARLDAVCPEWTWELVGDPVARDGVITQRGRLTVAGVYRDGAGMAAVVMTKDGKNEANEPEKSAATDAFKRAARMFGVGRYLLRTPQSVRDYDTLARWLNGAKPQPQQVPAPHQQQQPQQQRTPAPQQNAGSPIAAWAAWAASNPAEAGKPYKSNAGIFYTVALAHLYDNNTHHMKNSIGKAEQSGVLKPNMTIAQALSALATRNNESAA